jgi:hypothetical protein
MFRALRFAVPKSHPLVILSQFGRLSMGEMPLAVRTSAPRTADYPVVRGQPALIDCSCSLVRIRELGFRLRYGPAVAVRNNRYGRIPGLPHEMLELSPFRQHL